MLRKPQPQNEEIEALSDQRVDLAIKISLLRDKGVDPKTLSDLQNQLSELENKIVAHCRRFH